jgi:hypothetical protein
MGEPKPNAAIVAALVFCKKVRLFQWFSIVKFR